MWWWQTSCVYCNLHYFRGYLSLLPWCLSSSYILPPINQYTWLSVVPIHPITRSNTSNCMYGYPRSFSPLYTKCSLCKIMYLNPFSSTRNCTRPSSLGCVHFSYVQEEMRSSRLKYSCLLEEGLLVSVHSENYPPTQDPAQLSVACSTDIFRLVGGMLQSRYHFMLPN